MALEVKALSSLDEYTTTNGPQAWIITDGVPFLSFTVTPTMGATTVTAEMVVGTYDISDASALTAVNCSFMYRARFAPDTETFQLIVKNPAGVENTLASVVNNKSNTLTTSVGPTNVTGIFNTSGIYKLLARYINPDVSTLGGEIVDFYTMSLEFIGSNLAVQHGWRWFMTGTSGFPFRADQTVNDGNPIASYWSTITAVHSGLIGSDTGELIAFRKSGTANNFSFQMETKLKTVSGLNSLTCRAVLKKPGGATVALASRVISASDASFVTTTAIIPSSHLASNGTYILRLFTDFNLTSGGNIVLHHDNVGLTYIAQAATTGANLSTFLHTSSLME